MLFRSLASLAPCPLLARSLKPPSSGPPAERAPLAEPAGASCRAACKSGQQPMLLWAASSGLSPKARLKLPRREAAQKLRFACSHCSMAKAQLRPSRQAHFPKLSAAAAQTALKRGAPCKKDSVDQDDCKTNQPNKPLLISPLKMPRNGKSVSLTIENSRPTSSHGFKRKKVYARNSVSEGMIVLL